MMAGLRHALTGWLDPVLNPRACLEIPEAPPEADSVDAWLRLLESRLRQRVREGYEGSKQSLVRGHGLDFADLREYIPGDDIRKIDWNVFARTLSPHIKEYHEERQLTVWVFVDFTPSMFFGSGTKSKASGALDMAGLLGLLARYGRHKFGVYCMEANTAWVLPPRAGEESLQMALKKLRDAERAARTVVRPIAREQVAEHLEELARVSGKQASVFVLSDFMDFGARWEMPLGNLSHRCGLSSVILEGAIERQLPEASVWLPVFDPESGRVRDVDIADADFRRDYAAAFETRTAVLMQTLSGMGRAMTLDTACDAVDGLLTLLAQGGVRHAV